MLHDWTMWSDREKGCDGGLELDSPAHLKKDPKFPSCLKTTQEKL